LSDLDFDLIDWACVLAVASQNIFTQLGSI